MLLEKIIVTNVKKCIQYINYIDCSCKRKRVEENIKNYVSVLN